MAKVEGAAAASDMVSMVAHHEQDGGGVGRKHIALVYDHTRLSSVRSPMIGPAVKQQEISNVSYIRQMTEELRLLHRQRRAPNKKDQAMLSLSRYLTFLTSSR